MMRRPLLFTGAALLGIALFTNSGRAQESKDPHLPPARSLPSPDELIRVDDMLLWPGQYEQLMVPKAHRQANYLQVRNPLSQWFWDFGVIPYEMAPNFSDAERQRIRRWRHGRAPRQSCSCLGPRKPVSWR